MLVKDPLQVKFYEKKLGRALTEAEKHGEVAVLMEGITTYLEIKDLVFPYDFMSDITVKSLLSGKVKW